MSSQAYLVGGGVGIKASRSFTLVEEIEMPELHENRLQSGLIVPGKINENISFGKNVLYPDLTDIMIFSKHAGNQLIIGGKKFRFLKPEEVWGYLNVGE